jgi:hypothetical protein
VSARKLAACFGLSLLLTFMFVPSEAQAAFGIETLSTTARNQDGSVDLLAGTHPFEYEVAFTLNKDSEGQPEGRLRDIIVELPPGLVGNPQALHECTGADFEGAFPRCPGNTQIGVAVIEVPGQNVLSPVYNLTPPLGSLASIGFSAINLNSFQDASLRSGTDYAVVISDSSVPTDIPIIGVRETIWGVPADSSHDAARTCIDPETEFFIHGCPSDAPKAPFLSLPTSCAGPLVTNLRIDSLQEPGNFAEKEAESLGEGSVPEGQVGCDGPPFEPTIAAQPETTASDSPTGLHVNLRIPQNKTPSGTATAHLKDTVITLPPGLVVNPSSADGQGACSSAQIGLKTPPGATPIEFSPGPPECPQNSKLGTVQVESPAVDHPLPGAVYLAKQQDNPFNSLIALYVTVHDPITGVVAKLPGKVEPNPVTGQLRATFRENPQLPFEDFKVDFRGGSRAALTTPPTCGVFTTNSVMTPWTSPAAPSVLRSDTFPITSAAGGGGCVGSEAQMPNRPALEAGTEAPQAGHFSPFVLRLSRENGSQRIGAVNVTLPPGVSAKLAGVQECSEAQIAQAQGRNRLGDGALEAASPSCPQASEVGVVNVGAGSGSPFFVQGHAYLAGPYKGAPLSLAILTPALAGPFDLGVVVVRTALHVNEETAQVTATSDPLPTILAGIPLDIRSIAVNLDRPNFSLNPTNCNRMAVSGEAISTAGAAAPLSNRFQVGGCRGLDFTPKLSLSLEGGTRRARHPSLKAVLTQPAGQANIAKTSVALPPTEFIDPNHVSNPCTRPQFAENACPSTSVLGKARAFSPLLDKPLEGKVYFRANGGARKLPDIVADLNGQIHIVLVGFLDQVHKKGSESPRTRTTFPVVPDAPVSKFILELKGGKRGTIVNSANLCKAPDVALIRMTAQNNKARDTNQRIRTSCPG